MKPKNVIVSVILQVLWRVTECECRSHHNIEAKVCSSKPFLWQYILEQVVISAKNAQKCHSVCSFASVMESYWMRMLRFSYIFFYNILWRRVVTRTSLTLKRTPPPHTPLSPAAWASQSADYRLPSLTHHTATQDYVFRLRRLSVTAFTYFSLKHVTIGCSGANATTEETDVLLLWGRWYLFCMSYEPRNEKSKITLLL